VVSYRKLLQFRRKGAKSFPASLGKAQIVRREARGGIGGSASTNIGAFRGDFFTSSNANAQTQHILGYRLLDENGGRRRHAAAPDGNGAPDDDQRRAVDLDAGGSGTFLLRVARAFGSRMKASPMTLATAFAS